MLGGGNKPFWEESRELEQVVLRVLRDEDGLTDQELYERLKNEGVSSNTCSYLCLQLAAKGLIKRDSVKGKPLVNRFINGESRELEQIVLCVLKEKDGLTDGELADKLKNQGISSHTAYKICLQLAEKGFIKRDKVLDKPLVNRIQRDVKITIDGEYMERKVLEVLKDKDGLTDKEIVEELNASEFGYPTVHNICKQLAYKGFIRREKINSDAMRNYYNTSVEGSPIKINEGSEIEYEILKVLSKEVGMTDEQVKEKINRKGFGILIVGTICRQLANKGIVRRVKEKDKPIENFLA